MVNQHPAKFGDHRHCGSEDMFFVAEGHDSTCPRFKPLLLLPLKHMTCHTHIQEISGCRHNNLPVSNEGLPILITHVCWKNSQKLLMRLVPVCPEKVTRSKNTKKSRMAIAKLFELHANAKKREEHPWRSVTFSAT